MINELISRRKQIIKTIKINILIILIGLIPIMAFQLSGLNEKYSIFFILLTPIYVYIIGKLVDDLFLFLRLTRFVKSIKTKIPIDITMEKFYEMCDFSYQPYNIYVYENLMLLLGYEYRFIDLNQVDTLEFSISSPKYHSNFEWFLNTTDINGKISSHRLYKSLDAPTLKIKNNLEEPLRGYFSEKFPDLKILETV